MDSGENSEIQNPAIPRRVEDKTFLRERMQPKEGINAPVVFSEDARRSLEEKGFAIMRLNGKVLPEATVNEFVRPGFRRSEADLIAGLRTFNGEVAIPQAFFVHSADKTYTQAVETLFESEGEFTASIAGVKARIPEIVDLLSVREEQRTKGVEPYGGNSSLRSNTFIRREDLANPQEINLFLAEGEIVSSCDSSYHGPELASAVFLFPEKQN